MCNRTKFIKIIMLFFIYTIFMSDSIDIRTYLPLIYWCFNGGDYDLSKHYSLRWIWRKTLYSTLKLYIFLGMYCIIVVQVYLYLGETLLQNQVIISWRIHRHVVHLAPRQCLVWVEYFLKRTVLSSMPWL